MTIADYFCAVFIGVGEITGGDFSAYPNVRRWLDRMKSLKSWKKVHETIEGYGASLKGTPMLTV